MQRPPEWRYLGLHDIPYDFIIHAVISMNNSVTKCYDAWNLWNILLDCTVSARSLT